MEKVNTKINFQENYDPFIQNQLSLSCHKTQKVLVLGSTGNGKSALCNTLISDTSKKTYLESEKIGSCTSKADPLKVNWFDKSGEFILIDTPGMNDANENDDHNLENLVKQLKNDIITLNTFIIVFNSANPRLDEPMKAMLKLFNEMFTPGFLLQTIIVFTRWPYDEKDKLRRKENGESEELRSTEMNKKIGELLKFDTEHNPIPCFFICNSYNNKEIFDKSSDEEKKMFRKTLKNIKKYVLASPIYYCDVIKKTNTEKVVLKNKLKEQEKKDFLRKIACSGCKQCDCLQYYYSKEEFKKYAAAAMATITTGGGFFGGLAGALTGAGFGGILAGTMYFNYHICLCGHEKKNHYDPKVDTGNL